MDFDLQAAKEKWEREQKQRKEQARARLEQERKAKEEARKQREALEAEQRQRRLEEAEAAAAAREQEESDLFAGDGVRYNVLFQATLFSGDGDKIRLPVSSFEQLSSQGALEKGSMFFEISLLNHPSGHTEHSQASMASKVTHAGVLQFTAPEGFAELPIHVWGNLGLTETEGSSEGSHFVRVRYVRLPKCTYAKLQSEALDFYDIPNHKAVLESKLRQHATLSKNDLLTVQHVGFSYKLRVLELKPAANVSVLETDMEVDVIETPNKNTNNRLIPLEVGKPLIGLVEEGSYNYYKFSVDQKLLDDASKDDPGLDICLEVTGETSGDADLYVAAHPNIFPTRHQHQWSSHDIGTKIVHLMGLEKAWKLVSYSAGVYGFHGRAAYKIWLQLSSCKQHTGGQRVGLVLQQVDSMVEGFELCGNCRQSIPVKTIALHEAYCRRHNVVCNFPGCAVVLRKEDFAKHVHCPKCGESLQLEELEKHLQIFHEPQFCDCGIQLAREEMVDHKANSCPLRVITCKFCSDMVQAGAEPENIRDKLHGLMQHESICGARTAPCDLCGRAVMLKEMELHRAAAHSMGTSTLTTAVTLSAHSENMDADLKHSQVIHCPICSMKCEGPSAEQQLNSHLDDAHFFFAKADPLHLRRDGSNLQTHSPDVSDSSYRSSLSVLCPICGLAVHSERDLSMHMDMVH